MKPKFNNKTDDVVKKPEYVEEGKVSLCKFCYLPLENNKCENNCK